MRSALYPRSAFLSFGYLVRKAACSYLDIQPSELKVGVRATTLDGQPPTFEVYLVDALENGAGYCRYLAEQNRLVEEVLLPLSNGEGIAEPILTHGHASTCDHSCADCLREYGNSEYHAILDWRLAFDILRLSLDSNALIDLQRSYWIDLATRAAEQFTVTLGGQVHEGEHTHIQLGTRSIRLTHPLVLNSDDGSNAVNIFEVIRRPGKVIADLSE